VCVCVFVCALLPPTGESRDGAARSFSLFISLSFLLSSLNPAAGPLHAKEMHVRTSSDGKPERFAPRVICKWMLHERCGQPKASAVLAVLLPIRTAACEPEGLIDFRYGDSSVPR